MRIVAPVVCAVLYARSALRHETPEPEAFVRQTPPLYTLRMFGIEYATIHQLPKPYDTPLDTSFAAGALGLRGYSMQQIRVTLTITPSWDVRRNPPGGTFLFVHVLDQAGKRIGQIDAPIDDGMFPTWQRSQQFGSPLPIGLSADLAPGAYRVVLGAYRPNEPGRVPVDAGGLPPDVDGADTIQLATFTVGTKP